MVLTIQVALKDAEKVRRHIIENDLSNLDYIILKEGDFLYMPVKNKFEIKEINCEFAEKILKEAPKKETLKDLLSKEFSDEEIESLKTAYDMIGDIAVIEIDKEFENKEKIIAKAIMQTNPKIKTVLKKSGIHKGEFRTQDMEYVLGENKKISTHKENGVSLTLDVEKVYYSPRLSTDRKRIYEKVNEGENILCMFSGAAPYPTVFSKNTKAKSIVGIELNPDGHVFGVNNVRQNKCKNVRLINGDVKEVVADLNKQFIGLKSNTQIKNIQKRIETKTKLIELYLRDDELDNGTKSVQDAIDYLKENNIQVMIHAPHRYKCKKIDLKSKKEEDFLHAKHLFDIINKLVIDNYNVLGFIFHPMNSDENDFSIDDENELYFNINKLSKLFEYGYIENVYSDNVFSNKESILNLSKKLPVKGVCFDFAHFVHQNGWNKQDFEKLINEIKKYKEIYFHIVNCEPSSKKHTSLLREGVIDFKEIINDINFGIIEVFNKDESDPIESVSDYNYVLDMKEQMKFDRILMPLPKSAEDFLDAALIASKKGTIIHFYDFLDEKEFYLAEEKVKKACERNKLNYEIIELVKCGQHAPHVFRICLDFKII